jgi:hypothetical protein
MIKLLKYIAPASTQSFALYLIFPNKTKNGECLVWKTLALHSFQSFQDMRRVMEFFALCHGRPPCEDRLITSCVKVEKVNPKEILMSPQSLFWMANQVKDLTFGVAQIFQTEELVVEVVIP